MSPEERHILERSLELSEENHKILLKLQRAYRWSVFWGFIKIALIIVPLVIGYLYLEPYLGNVRTNLDQAKELFNAYQGYLK